MAFLTQETIRTNRPCPLTIGTQVLGVVNDLDERIALQNADEVYLIDVTPEAPVNRYGVYILDERPIELTKAVYAHYGISQPA